MMRPTKENQFDTEPIYNIKAVVEATGLTAATLRAWERRYGALRPDRNENGYRLYSAQDVAILRWLKARVDEGMAISQAIALLSRQGHEMAKQRPEPLADSAQGFLQLRQELLSALLDYDEGKADTVLSEAYAIHGPEAVGEYLIAPAIAQIGEQWHRGIASAAAEHFASNYLRRKLEAIINAFPVHDGGPLIVLGCAPNDWHELGLLLLYLLLRRRGYNVLYLGQSVPIPQFADEMRRLRPALVIISAATAETVPGLVELAQRVQELDPPRPVVAFGGSIFNSHPELRDRIPGIFLGESVRVAVEHVPHLLPRFFAAPQRPDAGTTDASVH